MGMPVSLTGGVIASCQQTLSFQSGKLPLNTLHEPRHSLQPAVLSADTCQSTVAVQASRPWWMPGKSKEKQQEPGVLSDHRQVHADRELFRRLYEPAGTTYAVDTGRSKQKLLDSGALSDWQASRDSVVTTIMLFINV